jgi:hypothetical protein
VKEGGGWETGGYRREGDGALWEKEMIRRGYG